MSQSNSSHSPKRRKVDFASSSLGKVDDASDPLRKANKLSKHSKPPRNKHSKLNPIRTSVLLVDPDTVEVLLERCGDKGGKLCDISAQCGTKGEEWDAVSGECGERLGITLDQDMILGEIALSKSKCHVFVVALNPEQLKQPTVSELQRVRAADLAFQRDALHPRLKFSFKDEMYRLVQFARSPVVMPEDLLAPGAMLSDICCPETIDANKDRLETAAQQDARIARAMAKHSKYANNNQLCKSLDPHRQTLWRRDRVWEMDEVEQNEWMNTAIDAL